MTDKPMKAEELRKRRQQELVKVRERAIKKRKDAFSAAKLRREQKK